MTTMRIAGFLAVTLSAIACGQVQKPSAESQKPTYSSLVPSESSNNILGGSRLSADNPGKKSAIALLSADGTAFCTGTLIAKNLVVTAAHCVRGEVAYVGFGDSMTSPSKLKRKVTETKAFVKDEDNFPNGDVAWVRFENEIPAGYAPAKILNSMSEVAPGADVTLVGYGQTGDDPRSSSGNRLTVDTVLEKYLNTGKHKQLLVFGPRPDTGACHGDSGGPAYTKVGGEWYLIGATNGIDDELTPAMKCSGGHSIYSFIGGYKSWISETSGIQLP